MLLRDLTIENYRSFEKYRLNNLARVNLLVGDNNCGKTSVLEAVRLFVSGGDTAVILDCLEHREETAYEAGTNGSAPTDTYNAVAIFHSNQLEPDFSQLPVIRLSTEAFPENVVEISIVESSGSTADRIDVAIGGIQGGVIYFLDSGRVTGPWISPRHTPESFSQKLRTHVFISAEGLATQQLSGMWSSVLRAKREEYVESALRVIHPSVGRIHILPGAQQRREILVDVLDDRTSLARLGGGSRTLLGLGIAIARAKDGILLVDEIDTGLHYSRLADMWRMVIQTAKDLDVQVFATTHSQDCIRAFAEAVWREESLAPEIALHSIDRRMQESVRFGADELQVVVDQGIEVR